MFFEEDEDWLKGFEVLFQIESAYDVGRCCFCMLLHFGLVDCELGWKEREPDGNQVLY